MAQIAVKPAHAEEVQIDAPTTNDGMTRDNPKDPIVAFILGFVLSPIHAWV